MKLPVTNQESTLIWRDRLVINLTMLALFLPVFSGYVVTFLMFLTTAPLVFDRNPTSGLKLDRENAKLILGFWNWGIGFYLTTLIFACLVAGFLTEAGSWGVAAIALGHLLVKYGVVWYCTRYFIISRMSQKQGIQVAIQSLAVCIVINFLYCMLQRYTGVDWAHGFGHILPANRFAYGIYRVSGFTSHPLTLGYSQAIIMVSCVALAILFRGEKKLLYMSMIGCTSAFLTLAISGSRGPFIVAIIGTSVASFSLWRKRLWVLLAGIICTSGSLFVIPGASGRFFEIFQTGNGGDERLSIWKVYVQAIFEHPWFGIGLKNFAPAILAYYKGLGADANIDLAHNIYLQVLCESGFVGLLGMMGWFSSWVFGARFIGREQVRHGILAVAVIAGVGGLTQNTVRDSGFLFVMMICTLLLIAVSFTTGIYSCDGKQFRTNNKNLEPGTGFENSSESI